MTFRRHPKSYRFNRYHILLSAIMLIYLPVEDIDFQTNTCFDAPPLEWARVFYRVLSQ